MFKNNKVSFSDDDTVVIQDEESGEIFYFVTTDTTDTIDYDIDTQSRVEFTAQYGELKSIKLLVEWSHYVFMIL